MYIQRTLILAYFSNFGGKNIFKKLGCVMYNNTTLAPNTILSSRKN